MQWGTGNQIDANTKGAMRTGISKQEELIDVTRDDAGQSQTEMCWEHLP
jgi:hypothetical protein